jgi:hypothetical protein
MPDPKHKMTPPRRAWLERLVAAPGTEDNGRPVTDCEILQWCARAFRVPLCDVLLTTESLFVVFGDEWGRFVSREADAGYVITRWGREALKRWPA